MRTEDNFPELSAKIEKSVIAALSLSEDNRMLYKDFKGHKSTAIKNALLSLEKEGYIRFVPVRQTKPTKTDKNFLQYLVGVELLNPKVSNLDANDFIDKFNKTKDAKTRVHILMELKENLFQERYYTSYLADALPDGTSHLGRFLQQLINKYADKGKPLPKDLKELIDFINDLIRKYDQDIRFVPTRSKDLIKFMAGMISEAEDADILREGIVIMTMIAYDDEKLDRKFLLNSLTKEEAAKLIGKVSILITKGDFNPLSWAADLLSYLDPNKAVDAMLNALENLNKYITLNGTYAGIVKKAYDNGTTDKEKIIKKCEEIIRNSNNESQKEEARIIIRKL
jgi:hypothetical protein